ncbi:MAG: TIGR02530 family flagellar biosynthesis protein [Bdellovibrionota bacterium]
MSELLIPQVGAIRPQQGSGEVARTPAQKAQDGAAFEKLLRGTINDAGSPAKAAPAANTGASTELKFSSHALSRIKDRGISMGDGLMEKLEGAVSAAAEKGSKESLILSKDAAFIVSVKNKTVITVMDRAQMNSNVFTNIDSTVVI